MKFFKIATLFIVLLFATSNAISQKFRYNKMLAHQNQISHVTNQLAQKLRSNNNLKNLSAMYRYPEHQKFRREFNDGKVMYVAPHDYGTMRPRADDNHYDPRYKPTKKLPNLPAIEQVKNKHLKNLSAMDRHREHQNYRREGEGQNVRYVPPNPDTILRPRLPAIQQRNGPSGNGIIGGRPLGLPNGALRVAPLFSVENSVKETPKNSKTTSNFVIKKNVDSAPRGKLPTKTPTSTAFPRSDQVHTNKFKPQFPGTTKRRGVQAPFPKKH